MEEVGALIAVLSLPTDSIFLDGDLGSGETIFSQGYIGCKMGIPDNDEINNGPSISDGQQTPPPKKTV